MMTGVVHKVQVSFLIINQASQNDSMRRVNRQAGKHQLVSDCVWCGTFSQGVATVGYLV